MEQEKFNEFMQATDVLYHMIWRSPSGGYIKDGKEYVCVNRVESLGDIKKSLANARNVKIAICNSRIGLKNLLICGNY